MKKFLKSRLITYLPVRQAGRLSLITIFLLAAFFRLYGLNWDQNHHLHPDERFLTMVTQAIEWPNNFPEHFNPQISPANPYNHNYNFFVYGTLPMYLAKAAAEFIQLDPYDYNNITLVGRVVSAIFDLGTLILIFFIAKLLINSKQIQNLHDQNSKLISPLLATFLYGISVLPIQLSHFYAVDTFLVFFIVLSFYLLLLLIIHNSLFIIPLLGISFGFALGCKITAFLFLPIIGLGFIFNLLKNKNLKFFIFHFSFFILFSYLALRLADPRLFATGNLLDLSLNPQFINNLKELKSFDNPEAWFPPAVQWLKTKPIIFPLKNMILWGLGLPLGALAIGGLIWSIGRIGRIGLIGIKKGKLKLAPITNCQLVITLWIIFLFIYQATRFAKAMRYFAPIYPFLAILSAQFLLQCISLPKRKVSSRFAVLLSCCLAVLLLIWPLAFVSIYSQPHSRVMASEWIYNHIPPGSTISCEHWDDCLPLGINGKSGSAYNYQTEMLTMYDPDTPEKWQKTSKQLEKIDYLILSSNRLWGSIPKIPERYPITAKFYEDLLANRLNFTKVAEITSYPSLELGVGSWEFNDSSADESFTVYDHPQVIIFKKRN